ncbi:MAG: hypothetical protein COA66_02885 [Arcobacter sp.]|nr:MAG: hypothetical protein COA66_02885 [Arcobacter sp.]
MMGVMLKRISENYSLGFRTGYHNHNNMVTLVGLYFHDGITIRGTLQTESFIDLIASFVGNLLTPNLVNTINEEVNFTFIIDGNKKLLQINVGGDVFTMEKPEARLVVNKANRLLSKCNLIYSPE